MRKSTKFGLSPKHYAVGYKKPPKHSQFSKGKSGNRSGRRKRLLAFADLAAEAFQSPITITEGDKKTTITKIEAMLLLALSKALKGDTAMIKKLLDMAPNLPAPPDERIWTYRIGPEQEKLFDTALKDAEEYHRTEEDNETN
jgi:hypothetical protein